MSFYSVLMSVCTLLKKCILFFLASSVAAVFFFLFYNFLYKDISLTTYILFKLGADSTSLLALMLMIRFLLIFILRSSTLETKRSLEYTWLTTVVILPITFYSVTMYDFNKELSSVVYHTVSRSIRDLILQKKTIATDCAGVISFICLLYLVMLALFAKQICLICRGEVSLSNKYKKKAPKLFLDQDFLTLHGGLEKSLMECLWLNEEVPMPDPSQREESFIEAFFTFYVCESDRRFDHLYISFLNIIHVLGFLFLFPAFLLLEILAFGLGRSFVNFLLSQDNEKSSEQQYKDLNNILNIGIRQGITTKSLEYRAFLLRVEHYKLHWFCILGIILYSISFYKNIVILYLLYNNKSGLFLNIDKQNYSFFDIHPEDLPQNIKVKIYWVGILIVFYVFWAFFFHIHDSMLEQNHFYKRLLREQKISNRDWMSIFSHNIINEAAGITRSIDLMQNSSGDSFDEVLASSHKLEQECERFFRFSKTIDSMMIEFEPCNLKEIVDDFNKNVEEGKPVQSDIGSGCWVLV